MERPFPAYRGSDPYLFVSYAHEDEPIVFPELSRLRSAGFNIWYDEGIQPGSTWREEVALALTESKLFLYFVSPNSVKSENCHQELNFALSRERKILAVHLTRTNLTAGIELSLSNKQAIMREDYAPEVYARKFVDSVRSLMPTMAPVSLPGISMGPEIDEKSIAILPFANRSSDPENEYLCDGMAEELISGLAKVKELSVASQLSSFGLKGQNLDTATIGAKLKVANVLTGSIQKSGERVRINVTLTEVASGNAIWSERYNGTLDDVFALQEDVARKVVSALKVELVGGESPQLMAAGTSNADAYDCFLRGRSEFMKSTRVSYIAANELFERATELDPSFGRAHFYQFITHMLRRDDGFLPQEEFENIAPGLLDRIEATDYTPPAPRLQFDRMITPDSTPPEPVLANELCVAIRDSDARWHGAEYWQMGVRLVHAGLLNGGAAYYKWYLDHGGEFVNDSPTKVNYLSLLFALGRFEKAIDHASNILAQQPDAVLTLGTRAMLYSRTGQYASVQRDLTELAKTFPRNFAQFYDLYWRRELDAAKAYFDWMDGQRNLVPLFKIWGSLLLGHMDKGMAYLEQANYSPFALRVLVPSALTPSIVSELTNDPRYKALLEARGLTDAWRDELLQKVNELEPITGIHVALDTEY